MSSPLLDGVPLLGQDYVTVKRTHLEWVRDLLVYAYRNAHFTDAANAAAHFAPVIDRPLTAALGVGGEAIVNYLNGEGDKVVLPHEMEGAADGPAA